MRLNPFRALRPTAELAARVASPPYDVVTSEEAAALAGGNEVSFLHVIKPEIDLPAGTDPYSDGVYAQARAAFDRLRNDGVLVRDEDAALFVYRQDAGGHSQTGLVGVCHIDEYRDGTIKKHENTLKPKEDDRTRHVRTLMANAGPVFLTYGDDPAIDAELSAASAGEPLYDLEDELGVRHRVWRVADAAGLCERFRAVPCAYVADGHHRSASAVRVGTELAAENPDHDGSEPYNWYLCVLFAADQLQVLAYNRLVADLNGLGEAEFLARVDERFERGAGGPAPARKGEICMYLGGQWHRLVARDRALAGDAVAALDVSVLQDALLGPILGIDDPKTNKRIGFKGGKGSPAALARQVDEGKAAVAFSLYPTDVRDMMEVADAGDIMPPKSTWFEPKLRSGLLVNVLESS